MVAQSFSPVILLTRPAAQARRFEQQLHVRFGTGQRVVVSPLMAPVFHRPVLPKLPFSAIVLTSETGAEAARRISAEGVRLPALAICVGDRTAEVAGAVGFDTISAAGDGEALVGLILRSPANAPLLYLRGHDSSADITNRLNQAGLETHEAIVYTQTPQVLTDEAQLLLLGSEPVVVPLFSPRTARLLSSQPRGGAPLWVAALSPEVEKAAATLTPERLALASRPDAPNMMQAIAELLAAGSVT